MKNVLILIYQTENDKVKIETHFENENVWLNIEQISALFQRDRTVISRHIKNIFSESELDEKVVSANFALTTKHAVIKG